VNRSLHDDAISVREAAVDLLGKHIGNDRDLAMTFFDLIGQVFSSRGCAIHLTSQHSTLHPRHVMHMHCFLIAKGLKSPALQAANDAGTSVRKRAVKILWESCIR
jgi:hypothetical protein